MARISKFLFETDFGEPPAPAAREPEADEVEVPTFSEEELQEAREHGYETGLAAGRAQALAGLESKIEASLEELCGRLVSLAGEVARQRQVAAADVVTLAKAIAAKVAGGQTAEQSLELIETLARACLDSLYQAPEATIRVGSDLAPALEARLGAVALPVAVAGAVDPALAGTDCRIEWCNGGARRVEREIWARIDEVLARYADATPPAAATAEIPPQRAAAPDPGEVPRAEEAAAEPGVRNNPSGGDHG